MQVNNLIWYANPRKPHHANNIRVCRGIIEELAADGVDFYNVNVSVAPWHIQCEFRGVLINWWPCALKAQIDGERSVHGESSIRKMLAEVRNGEHGPVDVFESFDAPDDEILL